MRRFPLVFILILATIPFASNYSANAAVNATTIYSMEYPDALAEDSAGNIYIVDNATTGKIGIVVVPASTGTLFGQSVTAGTAMTLVAQQDSLPSGVTVSSSGVLVWSLRSGDIYALASTNSTLFGVSILANTVTLIKAATTLTTGLDFDPAGNLFGVINTPGSFSVLPVESGTLFGQSVTANTSKELFTDGNHWFWDAAVDSLGNLYLADGWGDVAIGRGIFVLPKVTGTLYGQSVTANTLTRLTTFGTTIYASIDADSSDVLFANPYSGQTKALSAANVSIFNIAFTANVARAIPATSGYAWTGLLVTSAGALVLGGYSSTYKLVYTPDLTAPDSPTIGTATALSPTSASISFTAPTSNGGATIERYTATSTPGSITGYVSQSGSGTISISGLTASTAYTFRITATNSVGTSTASIASNSITLPASQAEIDAAVLAAQKAAEAKREAERQAARTEIWDCLSDSRTITINNFTSAEIYGVTKKNYDLVIQDINYKIFDESDTALIESKSQTIFVVEQVVKKYVILDAICYPGTFSQFSANDLASVDLIPYKNRNAITYNLRQLPLDQRNDYVKIENVINNEILVLEKRKERLDEVLSWKSPEDNPSSELVKKGIFPCGSGGTYTVVSGHVTGSEKCAGKLTLVSSVTAIDDYAFSAYRYLGAPSFDLVMQEPQITELVIPKTVLTIGMSAFAENDFLTSITISNSVTSIGRDAFKQSNNVTSLTIGSGAPIIESDTYQEFRYLTKLVIPEGVTRIDGGAFSELYSLTSLTLPSTLTTLGEASLRGMHSLRTINIPANLSSAYDPFHYFWYAPLSVPYLCSTTGASNTASVNAYFANLIAYNTTAGRCANAFDAPEIIGSYRPSSTTASIKFTAPKNFGAGTAHTSYEVIAFPGGKRTSFPSGAFFLNGAFTQKVIISSLNPGTSYWFEVVAINNESPFIASPPSGRRYVSAE